MDAGDKARKFRWISIVVGGQFARDVGLDFLQFRDGIGGGEIRKDGAHSVERLSGALDGVLEIG